MQYLCAVLLSVFVLSSELNAADKHHPTKAQASSRTKVVGGYDQFQDDGNIVLITGLDGELSFPSLPEAKPQESEDPDDQDSEEDDAAAKNAPKKIRPSKTVRFAKRR